MPILYKTAEVPYIFRFSGAEKDSAYYCAPLLLFVKTSNNID